MMQYVYPAIFHPNSDGSYTIAFPDLPGCVTEGKTLENALYMAQDALSVWLEYTLDHKETIPEATAIQNVTAEQGEFVNLIRAEIKDNRAVRRTVSLPKWMDDMVVEAGLSLSRVLQEALKDRLSVN
ncbi:MAG: type II toxin-antitoxin system HicB family antitoxin [Oscillospiraceae bacterium]